MEVPNDLKKHIKNIVANCKQLIVRRLKAMERLKELEEDIAVLEQKGYPSGIRPFRHPFEFPEIDEALPVMSPMQFGVFTVEGGTSYRDAMTSFRRGYMIAQRRIEVMLCQKQISGIETEISYDKFMKQCYAIAPHADIC